MAETAEARLKRMRMRSWRRGTKEMDLVFGPWADSHLDGLPVAQLDLFDRLLEENDQDLMAWLLGHAPAPDWAIPILAEIGDFAQRRLKQ